MRVLLEYYGKFVLESMVVIALVTLIFAAMTDDEGNQGIYAITGAQMKIDSIDYHTYTDFKGTYKKESEKVPPRIYFEGNRLEVGIHVLSDYIKAVDDAGNFLPIKILSIKAPDKTEMLGVYNQSTGEINLFQTGVYTVMVVATSDNNKSTKAKIQIPINHRKRFI